MFVHVRSLILEVIACEPTGASPPHQNCNICLLSLSPSLSDTVAAVIQRVKCLEHVPCPHKYLVFRGVELSPLAVLADLRLHDHAMCVQHARARTFARVM